MRILYVSDIHGNYPALRAVASYFTEPFDCILNGGDTTVYGPFPNETITWLRRNKVRSILGNTDRHIITLLNGGTFKKPRKPDKRIMYGWTAAELTRENRQWLCDQPLYRTFELNPPTTRKVSYSVGMYHGSPEDPDEFLFAATPLCRFRELAARFNHAIVTVGHSHSPFHKEVDGVNFINPGSTGRMFDGSPKASCAVITLRNGLIDVRHYRIKYPVQEVVEELARLRLPEIYQEMYLRGRKLN